MKDEINKKEFIEKLFPHDVLNKNNDFYQIIPVHIGGCRMGEIYSKIKNLCEECMKGTFSFDYHDQNCKNCKKNMECLGGNKIIIDKGYWRSSLNSDKIYICRTFLNNCPGIL